MLAVDRGHVVACGTLFCLRVEARQDLVAFISEAVDVITGRRCLSQQGHILDPE